MNHKVSCDSCLSSSSCVWCVTEELVAQVLTEIELRNNNNDGPTPAPTVTFAPTGAPTPSPSVVVDAPSVSSFAPSSQSPVVSPTTSSPMPSHVVSSVAPTVAPVVAPSVAPSQAPQASPTADVYVPSPGPSSAPSMDSYASFVPSPGPSSAPSIDSYASFVPSPGPSSAPSADSFASFVPSGPAGTPGTPVKEKRNWAPVEEEEQQMPFWVVDEEAKKRESTLLAPCVPASSLGLVFERCQLLIKASSSDLCPVVAADSGYLDPDILDQFLRDNRLQPAAVDQEEEPGTSAPSTSPEPDSVTAGGGGGGDAALIGAMVGGLAGLCFLLLLLVLLLVKKRNQKNDASSNHLDTLASGGRQIAVDNNNNRERSRSRSHSRRSHRHSRKLSQKDLKLAMNQYGALPGNQSGHEDYESIVVDAGTQSTVAPPESAPTAIYAGFGTVLASASAPSTGTSSVDGTGAESGQYGRAPGNVGVYSKTPAADTATTATKTTEQYGQLELGKKDAPQYDRVEEE